ncbi:MAG TPA: MFS transporter [Chloroflexota bacterium]
MRLPGYVRRHWADTVLSLAISSAHGGLSTLLPPMFREEGKGPVVIGSLVAVSAVMALLLRLPGGLLYSRGRARGLLLGSLVISAIAAALYPLTTDDGLLTAIGALDGIGFSAATTVNMAAMIESIDPAENRAGAVSFYVSGMSSGYAISSFLWSVVAENFGYGSAFVGMVVVYGLATVMVLLAPRPELVPRPALAALPAATRWRRAQNFATVLLDPVVMFTMLGAFFLNVFLSQFGTFLPLTLLPLGITLGQVGGLRSAWSLTNALGRPFGGAVLSVLDHRRTQTGSLIVQAAMLALFAFPLPFVAYLLVTIVAASGRAICYVANAVALSEVDPARVGRGVASGVMNAAGDLGNIVGPVTGGLIASAAGYQHFWLISPPLYLAIYFGALRASGRRGEVQGVTAAV